MRRLGGLLVLLWAPAVAQELPAPWRRVEVPAGPRSVGPALRSDAGGTWLSWLERGVDSASASELRLARYVDGKFDAPLGVRSGRDFFANWADFAATCADAHGDRLVCYLARQRVGYDLNVLRLTTDGPAVELGSPYGEAGRGGEHGFVSMLPEGDDGVRLFWLDGRGYAADQRMQLRTAVVRDGVAHDEEVLDPDVCSCCQTGASLVAGEPMVVYRGRDAGEIRDIKWTRRTAAGWSAPCTVAPDGWKMPGCPVNGPAVAAEGDRVAVAWFTAAAGKAKVRIAFVADAKAGFGPPVDLDADGPIGRVDVIATARGALVSWLGTIGNDAALYVQAWTAAGTAGPRSCLARLPAGRSTGFPRLCRVGDSVLLVWVEAESGRLLAATADLADWSGK